MDYKGFNVWLADPDTGTERDFLGRFEFGVVPLSNHFSFDDLSKSTAITRIDTYMTDRAVLTGFSRYRASYQTTKDSFAEVFPAVLYFDDTDFSGAIPSSKLKLVASNGFYAITTNTATNFDVLRGQSLELFDNNNNSMGIIPGFLTGVRIISFCFLGYIGTLDNSRIYDISAQNASSYYAYNNNVNTTSYPNIVNWFNAIEPLVPPSDDPYESGGNSEEGGGDGDFTDDTEDIDIPDEPSLSAADTKFITLYNPSKAQLDNLASYMWSTGFDLDTFKKLFADPMQCILGLSIVPVNVPSGGTKTVTVGNISTGISMTVASKQYVTVDCGSINVKKYWGAYLDYDPYTKAEIYLPYIGIHAIAVDDIMGKSVHVVYRVDILSGACTAFVKCGGSVLYQFVGQCASSIPVTGNDWTNVINGALTIAGSIGTMVATGGASAPLAVGAIASTCTNSLKPNVEKSGSMGGTGGLMGGQKPYLILTRPQQAKPASQNKYLGYPSFITSKVENLKGFTVFESIRLSDIPATQQELEELLNLLESGVIL